MVFDGLCAFCAGSVQLVLKMDRDGVIRFTPIQSPYGRLLAERAGVDASDPSTFLFIDCGRPLRATTAIAAMLARMPRPWRWLRFLAVIPRPLRDAAYRWVARNRYRLFGRRESCLMPSPAVRARFIDDIPASEREP
jgi:predicted DCC family thiol-disulfide oxidoreductase YuxK